MKKVVKIGFPIVCIVIVGGTLIALGNLKNKADKISENKVQNNVSNTSNSIYENSEYEYNNYYDNGDYEDENYYDDNENYSNNTVLNENTNTTSNTVENTITNNDTNTSKANQTEESTNLDNTSDKDKAIALVEEEWGEDSSVYFTNEGVSSGYYIVAVRDKSNTSVKLFYKVDLENNTVEVDW